jgi:hypothetical protein
MRMMAARVMRMRINIWIFLWSMLNVSDALRPRCHREL